MFCCTIYKIIRYKSNCLPISFSCPRILDENVDVCEKYDGIDLKLEGQIVCCAKSCGTCGGDGCETRPGGRENCCKFEIQFNSDNGANTCGTFNKAPCFILGTFKYKRF